MNALPSFAFPGGFDAGERSGSETGPQDEFVDEAALHRLLGDVTLEQPAQMPRRTVVREEWSGATDDADYAGWQAVPVGRADQSAFCLPADWCTRRASAEGVRKRPDPPKVLAARSAEVESDAVRWWLAIGAGVLVALVLALILLAAASRDSLLAPSAGDATPPAPRASAESPAYPP